jgi:hypothetical protein
LTESLGIVGAIEVECSPWFDDNQWVLDVAQGTRSWSGLSAIWSQQTRSFRRNGTFAAILVPGIRCGNLWDNNIRAARNQSSWKAFGRSPRAFLDCNPTVELLEGMVRVTDLVPDLR